MKHKVDHRKLLKFQFIYEGMRLTIGYLHWPKRVTGAHLDGDLAEVFETGETTAVFSLADVRLNDLYQ